MNALTSRGLVQVGIVKDEERAVTTELQCALLQAIRADLRNKLANSGASSESHLLDQRMPAESFAKSRGLVQAGREHREDALWKASLLSKVCKSTNREWSLWRWLDDHCAACCQSSSGFSQDRFEQEMQENDMKRRMMMESAFNLEVDLGNLGLDEQPEVSC